MRIFPVVEINKSNARAVRAVLRVVAFSDQARNCEPYRRAYTARAVSVRSLRAHVIIIRSINMQITYTRVERPAWDVQRKSQFQLHHS